jgi:hypothetical protein
VERGTWRWVVGLLAALTILAAACTGNDGGDGDDAGRATPATDAPAQTPALPTVEGPITGPGAAYVDPLEQNFPEGASAAANGYVFDEYFASGTAAGEPYRVRVEVVRPGDTAARPFSGHAIVEAIHPQGIPFVWNFTRDYLMSRGHAAVNISVFPNTVDTLKGANEQRYADLRVAADEANDNSNIAFDHASDIYAQVGSWLKSEQSPLPGLEWLHMTGHSMSVGPVWQYMDTHHGEYRLENGDPIYDGFFPETTRTASRMGPFPEVDVPTLLINSELEVEEVLVKDGIDYRRPDSDEPGEQFRLYEVAGMPHNPSWMHPLLLEDLDIASRATAVCANPLNSFPYNPTVSMALEHLIRWVEDDEPPPRAKRIKLTGEPGDRDVAIARDEHDNARGGVRSTTLDVPVATHQALNQPINEDEDLTPGSCLVYGTQLDFAPEELKSQYGDKEEYVNRVNERLEELVAEGWLLEQFADELQDQAENFDGFDR